ncbi:hypothetical protein GIB67_021335 [Kingdonia uniflora]|uniref:ACT domain-containing protein ACR n=1 Tax=Kingdonia uniflora TaxID=39325 RepID=A0A7J7KZE0_9MAGN|nr:hypothetical protein GIB67_021335 [Kingdonia uniflora]
MNLILKNSMILGCVHNEKGRGLLELFDLMKEKGIKADHVTFQGVLRSCISEGFVDLGKHYFESMSAEYCIIPRLEQYESMIELFSRKACLDEMEAFVHNMLFEPTVPVLKRVINVCKEQGIQGWKNGSWNAFMNLCTRMDAPFLLIGVDKDSLDLKLKTHFPIPITKSEIFICFFRVEIDNAADNTTIVEVDSARKPGILLEAVQVLTDLNLSIKKADISSVGKFFLDVYHVTDQNGNKLTDENVIRYIQKSLGTHNSVVTINDLTGLTALELTGTDRLGLLSEVFGVLKDLDCNVVKANVWTHNGRIASLIFVKDVGSGSPIEDSKKIGEIVGRLRYVLKGDSDIRGAKTTVAMSVIHTERRLHQMMFADRDYEEKPDETSPKVSVHNWLEKNYSIVFVTCKDRRKLLFDTLCTLTDMGYVVFHARVDTPTREANMEFWIQHTDGTPIKSDGERQRVIQCLQAAIERRASEGVRLELYTQDRQGLLSDVTRTFRENGLNVTRAEISTTGDMARNIFYVTDTSGHNLDPKLIDGVCEKIGLGNLRVKESPLHQKAMRDNDRLNQRVGGAVLESLGSLLRRNLSNLGLIKSS